MELELINAVVMAAMEVLRSETGLPVKRGPLSLQTGAFTSDDVTVLFSLVGQVAGTLFYGMSEETARGLTATMLGQEVHKFDDLAQSGVAELGNVITGRASMKMAIQGYSTDISVPTLLIGQGATLSTLDIERLFLPLQTEAGPVHLGIALRLTHVQGANGTSIMATFTGE